MAYGKAITIFRANVCESLFLSLCVFLARNVAKGQPRIVPRSIELRLRISCAGVSAGSLVLFTESILRIHSHITPPLLEVSALSAIDPHSLS